MEHEKKLRLSFSLVDHNKDGKRYYRQVSNIRRTLTVWYKTKFGSQNLATKFGSHLCMATKIGRQS